MKEMYGDENNIRKSIFHVLACLNVVPSDLPPHSFILNRLVSGSHPSSLPVAVDCSVPSCPLIESL